MSPEQWRLARQVFDRAVECEPTQRDEFIERECAGNQPMLAEVRSLIDSWKQSGSVFERPLFDAGTFDSTFESKTKSDHFEGQLAGPYRILRRLGRGGMGAVYLAERADDQFRRQVALKLVRPGFDDGQLVRRFRNELQMLAVLDHPNIVKLHDAGVTDDGIPYFVMDFVEGQPLDRYCESRNLPLPDRLQLFRGICGAVHYAHRNLVVHRDLKPANILVTPDGMVKLLDFGIAKLLRPEYGAGAIGLTRTMMPMTPEYASPEQLHGQPVTTSSDVYSLGVILYYLVSGRHPYGKTNSALELERAVCETDPERPSAIGRKTGSDLDNVVLMAMRKEPQRRYASAEHLSEDVRRYLEALPVTARANSVVYRANRFVARHRAAVAVSVLAVLGLAASAAFAWTEKGRAERAFQDLRSVNDFMLFDLDRASRNGLTAERRLLVDEGVRRLDRMARESGNDAGLLLELSDGYHALGNIQGNPLGSNLGDTAGARTSYNKALELAESARRIKDTPAAQGSIGGANLALGEMAAFAGSASEAEQRMQAAIRGFAAWGTAEPVKAKRNILVAWQQLGSLHELAGDLGPATQDYTRSLGMARELAASSPSPGTQRDVMRESIHIGSTLAKNGQSARALEALHEALSIAVFLSLADPSARRDVAAAHNYLGYVLDGAGRSEEAAGEYRRAIATLESLAAEDASDQRARRDLGQILAEASDVFWRARQAREASELSRRAKDILAPLADRENPPPYLLRLYAHLLLAPQNTAREDARALQLARQADDLTKHRDPETLETLAQACAVNGDAAQARRIAADALATLPPGAEGALRNKLRSWSELAAAPAHEPRNGRTQ